MACSTCGGHPKNADKRFTKAVVEIHNPEQLVLLRKVVIPSSMGDDKTNPATIGKYFNVLLNYEANNHTYIYSSDGIPTLLTTEASSVNFDDILNPPRYGGSPITSATNIPDVAPVVNAISEINDKLDTDVATGVGVSPTSSASTVQLNVGKQNLLGGETSSETVTLPLASTTTAGVLSSATFDAISNNSTRIDALLNGAVAVTGLSASPSQADLTTAWQTTTGLTDLMNRASIYDVTNSKVWTYYSNDATWYASSNTPQVVINTFTNNTEGTIKGSTNAGQISAESDGTGSVNGWNALVSDVANKQNALTAGSNITISGNTISATDTTYSAGTGLDLANNTFSVDTNTIAQKSDVPVITLTTTDPGEGQPLAANHFIGVYE